MSYRELSPNVYGIEFEYSAHVEKLNGDNTEIVGGCHSIDDRVELYEQPIRSGSKDIPTDEMNAVLLQLGIVRNHFGFTSNGARYYNDPSGGEYCTAEHATAGEATIASLDGDALVFKAFRRLNAEGVIGDFQLNRRIVDHNRSSRGIHLNHMTSLDNEPSLRAINALATLNVLKGALFGSGGLLVDKNNKTSFHHSPRLSLTNIEAAGLSNYTLRPLVRLPFKKDGKWHRVETVTSDALNFAWPVRASLVATNTVLRLIELGCIGELPMLNKLLVAAKTVGQHGNRQLVSIETSQGRSMGVTPAQGLKMILESALYINDKADFLDTESKQVTSEIIDVADIVDTDWEKAALDVESIARYLSMQRRMNKGPKRLTLDSETMCRFDYAWDVIGGIGIAQQLREGKSQVGWRGFDKSLLSPAATRRRLITPPQDTRAKLRGDIINAGYGDTVSDWSIIGGQYREPIIASKN